MITVKLPYSAVADFYPILSEYRRQQSALTRFAYNRYKDGCSKVEVERLSKQLGGIDSLDSWMVRSAIYSAFNINKDKTIIFGGKKNWIDFIEKKITKDQFKDRRLRPFISIGEAPQKGNRKFSIDSDNLSVEVKFNSKVHFTLNLPSNLRANYRIYLAQIEEDAENKKSPFMVRLDDKFITISFEPRRRQNIRQQKKCRVLSIDMNPNEIGFSVVDFESSEKINVIHSGIIDNAKLNELAVSANKRRHETYEVSKYLIELAKHYRCSKFIVENLTITNHQHDKGRRYNRLVNNCWNRSKLEQNLQKRCLIDGLEFIKVNAVYSSLIGNAIHTEYPDPINASIEIARRGFYKFVKNRFYPKLVAPKNLPDQWKETVDYSYESWRELFDNLKKMKLRYHFSWKEFPPEKFQVSSLKSSNSGISVVKYQN